MVKVPRKIDLACGLNKTPGFVGIDIAGDADIVHDLLVTPWPLKDDTVTEAVCHHFVEHIPHWRPGFDRDGWFVFFNELYRVMKNNGKATFTHPYAKHDRAFWDPTHERYIHETMWYYLDKSWLEMQGLSHYPSLCDFEVTLIDGVGVPDSVAARNHEHQAFARNHYWNVIADLSVTLKARK